MGFSPTELTYDIWQGIIRLLDTGVIIFTISLENG